MARKTLSPLANLLRAIFDEARLFSRAQWATVLGVSEPAISKWVTDETIPSPENLRAIARTMAEDERLDERYLVALEELAGRPLGEILAPGREPRDRTLAHYMARPVRESFNRALDDLPPAVCEEVIQRASEIMREYRDREVERQLPMLVRRRPADAARAAVARAKQKREQAEGPVHTELQRFRQELRELRIEVREIARSSAENPSGSAGERVRAVAVRLGGGYSDRSPEQPPLLAAFGREPDEELEAPSRRARGRGRGALGARKADEESAAPAPPPPPPPTAIKAPLPNPGRGRRATRDARPELDAEG